MNDSDILFFEKVGNTVVVSTPSSCNIVGNMSLSALHKIIPHFMRTDRRHLVNPSHIKKCVAHNEESDFSNRVVTTLIVGNKEIPCPAALARRLDMRCGGH